MGASERDVNRQFVEIVTQGEIQKESRWERLLRNTVTICFALFIIFLFAMTSYMIWKWAVGS